MGRSMMWAAAFSLIAAPTPSALFAQAGYDDAMIAAASWVVEESGIDDLGRALVVDTTQAPQGPRSTPLRESEILRKRVEIAAALGARTGASADYMRCPRERTPARSQARGVYHGCRLTGGAAALIEVGEPQSSDVGTIVMVVTRFFERLNANNYRVVTIYREVVLDRTPAGLWEVEGVRLKAIN